jgi:LmbE family N-acetylglucosaminyl deacetylase
MNIIAVGAHLDDLELACGGTLAKAIKKGHNVKMIVMSQSGYIHYSGKYKRDADVAIKEGHKAAAILGVKELKIYDFPNKDIPNDSIVVETLNQEFDVFRPDLIFTHWQFDTHKSHVNTALASFAAGRYFNSILIFEPFPPAGRSYMAFRPQLYVDISETIDIKVRALSQHKSELNKYGPEWIETIKSRARLRGFEMIAENAKVVTYAETFEIVRLGLNIF